MIKLIKNTFYKELLTKLKLIWFILFAKQLSFGEKCIAFEKTFSLWQKRKGAVFVNSGSSANLILIQALLNAKYIKKGDRVGFSALGWATTVMPLIQLGLVPVPIDINLETLNIDEDKIPPKLKMLFVTHLLGRSCNMEAVEKMCRAKNILLCEDVCEAMGSVYKGKRLGNFGLASTFSFYVGHHMSTIEGGMVVTDDPILYDHLVMARAHGWGRRLSENSQKYLIKKYKTHTFYQKYAFYSLGYNLRPTEMSGFIGLVQMEYVDKTIKVREKNYEYVTGKKTDMDVHSSFAIPVICENETKRDEIVLKYKNMVELRPIVGGDLTMQPFFKYPSVNKNARLVHACGFYMPNNPSLQTDELDILKTIYEEGHYNRKVQ